MINDYITFNAARFTKDYYRYKRIVEGLKEQLEEIDYVRSVPIDAEKVQSSPKGDQIEKLALRRIAIEERIHDYEWHIKTFELAHNYLLPDEKVVIEEFFTQATKADAVAKLAQKGISQSNAYKIRKEALEKISEAVAGIVK